MRYQSTPGQREALVRVTQEFADIRRRFEENDRFRDDAWASTRPVPAGAVADWEHLLDAVKSKLRQVADTLTAAGDASGLNGHAGGVSSDLLESMTALDRVHVMLAHELALASAFTAPGAADVSAPPPRAALALLYVDLDDFRSIDGARGRAAGDEVLAIIAVRLTGVVRVQDTVRQLGGNALACVLDDWGGREQLLQLVSKLADAASAPVTVGAVEVTVRPTIGIATGHDGASAEILLRRADAAMTRAKRQQTSYAFFDGRTDG